MKEVSTSDSQRFSYHRTSNGLGIEIPAKRRYFTLVFACFWLTGWTVGGIFAGSDLFLGDTPIYDNLSELLWMAGWVLGLFFMGKIFLWQLFGFEMIFVTAGSLVIENRILFPYSRKIFAIEKIRNLKIYELPPWLEIESPTGKPSISFEYGAKNIRFAYGLDEFDANELLEVLKKDMPSVFKSHYSN